MEKENDLEVEEQTTDWEAEAKDKLGKLKRLSKKYDKLKEQSQKPQAKPETKDKSGELDYGQKAFLTANGIKGKEEFKFVEDLKGETGKELEDLIEMKYFKARLDEFREAQTTKTATPSSTKRSSVSAKDKPEYWLKKPFKEVPLELRREVLKLKEKKIESQDKFTSNPTIS